MDTNFDVKEWVNKVFHQPKEPGVANDVCVPSQVLPVLLLMLFVML